MNKTSAMTVGLALAILALAGYLLTGFFNSNGRSGEMDFFYDLSEKKLFTGPRGQVPPIRGINDSVEDGVRAIVISTNGNPSDKSARKIAYLEKYSPELKQQIEAAKAGGSSPAMGRAAAQSHRFVKRLEDNDWYSMTSDEGLKIVTDWANPGSNGTTPVVCTP